MKIEMTTSTKHTAATAHVGVCSKERLPPPPPRAISLGAMKKTMNWTYTQQTNINDPTCLYIYIVRKIKIVGKIVIGFVPVGDVGDQKSEYMLYELLGTIKQIAVEDHSLFINGEELNIKLVDLLFFFSTVTLWYTSKSSSSKS